MALSLALALAVPAHADQASAPGQEKQQADAVTQAPAPAPTGTAAPAPAAAAPAPTTTTPTAQANTHAVRPVTKGTVKKLAATQPASSGSSTPARTVSRSTRRVSRRSHAASASATRTRANARRGSRRHASTSHHAAPRHSATAGSAAPAQGLGSRRAAHPIRRPAQHRLQPAAADAKRKKKAAGSAPLTSISRAADRVIEVIPGAVVLALAGLTALVFILIVRSWFMERTRSRALEQSYGVTVEALATAIEAKDHTTGGHIERVRRLGVLLANEVAPREARNPQMEYGFLLHDIGKLAVPDAILRAPGRLTEDQWALMRRHPDEGVRMLAGVPFLDQALDVVRHHHERWDGGGYPDGLRGEEIPLWARIFSVVDALDAMTADRPYRAGRSFAEALEEIRRASGTQFDPAVVAALERIDPERIEPLLEPRQLVAAESPLVEDLTPLIPA